MRKPKKLVCATGICVGVAALVSHGVEYTQLLEATADLSRGRLYDRIVPDGIVLRRRLGDWSTAWLHWLWLAFGAVVASCAITRDTKRKAVWTIGLGIALGWTVLDLWYGIDEKTIRQLVAAFLINIAGGLIGSAVFLLAIVTEEEVRKETAAASKKQETGYKFGMIGGFYCMAIMVLMYYAVGIFVQPRQTHIRVASTPPVQFVIGSERTKKEESDFGPIGESDEINKIEVTYGEGLKWVWEAHDEQEKGDVLVAVLRECNSVEEARRTTTEIGNIQSNGIRRVEIRTTATILSATVLGKQKKVAVEGSDLKLLRTMWIEEEDEEGKRRLTEFSGGRYDLIGSTEGSVELFTNALTLQREEAENLEGADVVWEVTIDDSAYKIRIPPWRWEGEEKSGVVCKAVEMHPAENGLVTEEAGLGGLYVKVQPTEPGEWGTQRTNGSWRFERSGGWVDYGKLPQSALDKALRSEISAIWLNDGVEDVYIDWTKTEVPMEARFRGHGDGWVWYSKEGRVIAEGTFHAAWLGGRRINQTTWESMSAEIKVMAATGVLSALLAVGAIVYRRRERWLEGWRSPLD